MGEKISIIGVGKLGLCLALNLEKKGFEIIGVDKSKEYIELLSSKKFVSSEPYVTEMLKESQNIQFTSEISKALENDIIFVVVATPSTTDWKYDHTQIDNVIDHLMKLGPQENRKELIINCTTFPGYCDSLQEKLKDFNYHISYNPEFIAQGSIIKDQLNCDNVLIGQSDDISGSIIESIYIKLCDTTPIINKMSRTEAEITKLSVNCFLTTKISYANMIGDITLRYGGDPKKVLNAVGTDSRIGNKYLSYGFGFGGPCFPRDNRALIKCGEEVGVNAIIARSTDEMNEEHLKYQVEYFVKNNPDKDKIVDIEYVTYKKESVSLEESQQLKYALELHNLGYKINVQESREEVINQIKNLIK
jgi:nucleotide sugar dehydrogenase